MRRVTPAERRRRVTEETMRVRAARARKASGQKTKPRGTNATRSVGGGQKTKSRGTSATTRSVTGSQGHGRAASSTRPRSRSVPYSQRPRSATITISTRPAPRSGGTTSRSRGETDPRAARHASVRSASARSRARAGPMAKSPISPGPGVRLAGGLRGGALRLWGGLHVVLDAFIARTSPAKGPRLLTTPLKTSPKHTRRRLVALIVIVCLLFGSVVAKLAHLQVLNPEQYQQFGASQRLREQTLAADRGTIYDRNGVELALSLPQKSVFVDPKLIADPASEARTLSAVLGVDPAEVEEKMRRTNRFSYVARFLTDDMANKVADLNLPGVAFVEEPKRHAPAGEALEPIVGDVDVDGKGIAGLERLYTDELAGTPGKLVLEQAPDGRTIPVGEHSLVPAVKGDDLVLTIDRAMQFEVQRLLSEQVAAVDAKGGAAVVMRPDTGEILAVVSVTKNEKNEVEPDGNLAGLTMVYEPGSVMKVVTIAGAIQDGKVTPDTVIPLPSTLTLADATFSDAEGRGAVNWPVSTILSNSSNVGTILVGQRLGKERIVDYMHGFGLGAKTGIDFPGEQSGVVPAAKDWWASTAGSVPIGQSVSVTPVQMLGAYNTIANGGTYLSPKLVNATIDANGMKHPLPDIGTRQTISPDTANKMNVMLRQVVATGTGTKAAVPGYTVAGKTGTSRKPQPGGGYMAPDGTVKYQATFVGFAPAEAPKLSVLAMVDEPAGGQIYGGLVAAPLFARITEFALRQLGVPPPLTDVPAGGAPADPEAQAKMATKGVGHGGAATPEDTMTVEVLPDGRKRGVVAGLPPAPLALPAPATTQVPGTAGGGGNSPAGTRSGAARSPTTTTPRTTPTTTPTTTPKRT